VVVDAAAGVVVALVLGLRALGVTGVRRSGDAGTRTIFIKSAMGGWSFSSSLPLMPAT